MSNQAEQLREFLQDNVDDFGPDDVEGAVLNRSVVITSWVDVDGTEWITWVSCNARGEVSAAWDTRGLIDHVRSHLDARMVEHVRDDDE